MIAPSGLPLADYVNGLTALMQQILAQEAAVIAGAAERLATQIAADRLVHIFGPGGHSNLAAQEIFFRAGGLMHVSAILDEGTLLSSGALRSTSMERMPGYGRLVIANQRLGPDDVLILVNAFGVNAAVIDAATAAQERGVFVIGISSHALSKTLPSDHPARHPGKANLHDIVDIAIDSKVPLGDALLTLPGVKEKLGPASTFANAFILNALVIETVAHLARSGVEPPIWRSNNAPGGDEDNARFIARFQDRVRQL